ncbi:MAG TPA: TolC family protein [Nannocystis sp.]
MSAVLALSLLLAQAPPGCSGQLGREAVVRCALAASPGVEAAERAIEAAEGRKRAARTVLPGNPVLEVTAAARRELGTAERDVNVYSRLSQEIEIAGQRRKRIAVAEAEIEGQRRRALAVRREVAAEALRVYYELAAAQQQQAMIERLTKAAERLVDLAATGEKAGLVSGLAADLAASAVVKFRQQQVEAERRVKTGQALLSGLLGHDPATPAVSVVGDLSPIGIEGELPALIELALARRAEIEVAAAEQAAQERLVEFYRRARVPNPSLVAFAQRDGFAEQVLGGGIALPIPLPAPLGRTYAGEIAESRARVRQAAAELERVRRQVRAEVVAAYEAVKARQAEVALFDAERLRRAEVHLEGLAEEMVAGRIAIREGVVMQQAFLDLLAAHIEARRALALAGVELARVTGRLPEDVTR